MPSTEDFAHVLDLENVRAIEWLDDEEKLVVRVSKKIDPDKLPEGHDVTQVLQADVEVVDEDDEGGEGAYELFPAVIQNPDNEIPHREKQRPVSPGVSEIRSDTSAATAGPLAVVRDPSKGKWADSVERGDVVRTSNSHVYAMNDDRELDGDFGQTIIQPSPYDDGTEEDKTGEFVGFVDMADREFPSVDVAARSVGEVAETPYAFGPELDPKHYGTGIYRGDFAGERGRTVRKTGRTTGVTTGPIGNTDAMVNVNIGGDIAKFRNVAIVDSGDFSDGGDSGSPIFFEDTGELCGLLFAGSSNATIFCKLREIEANLGVEYRPFKELQGGDFSGELGESVKETDKESNLVLFFKWLKSIWPF